MVATKTNCFIAVFLYILCKGDGQSYSRKVLVVLTKNSSLGLEEVWNTSQGINLGNGSTETLPVESVILNGTFRSTLVDNWSSDPPDHASLVVTNAIGDTLWWMFFNTSGTHSPLSSWMTTSNILNSSANSVPSIHESSFYFNHDPFDLILSLKSNPDMIWLCMYRNSSCSVFLFTSPQIPQQQSYLGTKIYYDNHSSTGYSEMAVYDDDKIIKIDQLMACAKESFLANIVRSYIFTIKHSMLRCSSTASLEYILENGAPKRFETPGSGFCITTPYQTIQSIFVRCIVVTVLTSESDFYFQFKTKDLKGTFVAGDAVVITGYWLQEPYTQYFTTTGTDIVSSENVTKLDVNTTLNDLMTTTVISSNHNETTLETGTTGYTRPESTSSSDKITTTSDGTVVEATTIMTTSSDVELSSVTTSTSEPSITAAVTTAYQNNTEEYLNSTLSTGLYTTEYNNLDKFSTQTTLEEETILVGFCVCKCTGSGYNYTEEELADRILQRKIETQLIKKNLTAYYRSLTSANDQRMSSQCIGYIGSVILVSCLCLLTFCDFRRFLYYCIIERHLRKHVS